MRSAVHLALAIVLTLCPVAACDDAGSGPSGSWVGALEGTDAVVALVADGDRVLAYVCGGDATRDTHTRWFSGPIDSGDFELFAGAWSLTGTLTDDGDLTGVVTSPGGDAASFDALGAEQGTLAGLYVEIASPCSTGLVITQPTVDVLPVAQGAWCLEGGAIGQVVPIMPLLFEGSGVAAELVGISTDAQRHLGAVLPAEGLPGT